MKKILLITYHFPPDAAVGAVRAAKFAKFLPEFGWEPMILTVKKEYYDVLDQSPRDTGRAWPTVIRTRMLRNPKYYHRKLKHVLWRETGDSKSGRSPSSWKKKNEGINLRQLISSLLSFPDEEVGWVPFAIIRGIMVMRKEGVCIVMTSGPPNSVHLIGACLSKLSQIPWIADFRDPDLDSHLPYLDSSLRKHIEGENSLSIKLVQRLRAWFVSQAAFIMTTAERFTEHLRSIYPAQRKKFFTVPNGYDPDDFTNIPREKEKRFTISYVGTFYVYLQRDPEMILRTLSELVREQKIDPHELAVRFVGGYSESSFKAMSSLIAKYGLIDSVEILPWLPRHQALEVMVRSHVLLVLAEQQPLQIPGKVYDYIGAGSNILAITGDGATSDLLSEIATGIVVHPGDDQMLKNKIQELYLKYLTVNEYGKDGSLGEGSPRMKYNRRFLARELARLLEKVKHDTNVSQDQIDRV